MTGCNFGFLHYDIGDSWHPDITPFGVMFCLICTCTRVSKYALCWVLHTLCWVFLEGQHTMFLCLKYSRKEISCVFRLVKEEFICSDRSLLKPLPLAQFFWSGVDSIILAGSKTTPQNAALKSFFNSSLKQNLIGFVWTMQLTRDCVVHLPHSV